MNILLAIASACAHSMHSVAVRLYQTKLQKSAADFRLFQGIVALLVSLVNLAAIGFSVNLDPTGLVLAILYGVDLAATGMLVALCFSCGPMSLTSVISNACVALPIAVGCIFYEEVMTLPRILGCVLLAGTFLLSAISPGKKEQRIQPRWYILVFLAFISNGMGAVLLNIYGRTAGSAQQGSFLSLGYFVSALIFFSAHLLLRRKGPVRLAHFKKPFVLLPISMSALGGFIGNSLLMSLNAALPATVLYPMVNGGIAVLVAAASCVFFREKLTLQRLLTILLGLCAIVALNL